MGCYEGESRQLELEGVNLGGNLKSMNVRSLYRH